jgi:uncharacterized membrane protein
VVSLVATRREFVKWHAKQGLLVLAVLFVLYVLKLSIGWVWIPVQNVLLTGFWMIGGGLVLAMMLCIIRGLEGERFKIPLLGDLADLL